MEEKPLPQIRTYEGDIANALKNQEESLVSIRSSELARKAKAPEPVASEGNSTNILFFILGIIFLIGGSVAGYLTYNKYQAKTLVLTVSAPVNRFIVIDEERSVDVTGFDADKLIKTRGNEELALGKIRQIQLNKGAGSQPVKEFLLIWGGEAPDVLVRNLYPEFMFGEVGGALPQTFIILKTASYESAFAGMLQWEEALPAAKLPLGFFSPSERLLESQFVDLTIKNKDVRVLNDKEGKGVLYYTFYGERYMLMTGSIDALKILLDRLDSATLKR